MRTLFVLIFLQISFAANAQTVKPQPERAAPFKVKLGLGYASTGDKSGNKALGKDGFVYNIEPQYELFKNIEVGLRLEQALIQRPEFIDKNIFFQGKAKSTVSAVVTANYVLRSIGALKPYFGLGAGFYYVDSSEQFYRSVNTTVSYPLPKTTAIGGLGRVGVRYGITHIEADYNLIGDTNVKITSTGLTLTAINSYFSIKAGITIGGSR